MPTQGQSYPTGQGQAYAPAQGSGAVPSQPSGTAQANPTAPGQYATAPGHYASAPGQYASAPGQYATAPGQYPAPGQYASAPGQYPTAPGQYPPGYGPASGYPTAGYPGTQAQWAASYPRAAGVRRVFTDSPVWILCGVLLAAAGCLSAWIGSSGIVGATFSAEPWRTLALGNLVIFSPLFVAGLGCAVIATVTKLAPAGTAFGAAALVIVGFWLELMLENPYWLAVVLPVHASSDAQAVLYWVPIFMFQALLTGGAWTLLRGSSAVGLLLGVPVMLVGIVAVRSTLALGGQPAWLRAMVIYWMWLILSVLATGLVGASVSRNKARRGAARNPV